MSFFSTRGGAVVTASQAILTGLAPGGGLYVPAMYPQVSRAWISSLSSMPYAERAAAVLSLYLEDYTPQEIADATAMAYTPERFDTPEIAPVRRLDSTTWLLELFHGPTLAFKDMALQLLPHLVCQAARKNGENREISILVATSGDTGKAALEGFRDVPGTSCTVFYPEEGVSDIQKLQMTTTGGSNTRVIAVEGNFDDAQTGVKTLFGSKDFAERMGVAGRVLSSANSINFGRLVPQVVYYFSAYADLCAGGEVMMGDPVNFVVPTGNFGDILAGWYAMNMGLPVKRLICASNRNNVLTDFFNTGLYNTHRLFYKTTSPSMDILVSSNLERLLYEIADRDGDLVRVWMDQLKEKGSYSVGEQRRDELMRTFTAGFANDRETAEEIATLYAHTNCVVDTHTAVATRVLRDYRARTHDLSPAVVVSTASPYKFCADVLSALKGKGAAEGKDAFACAEELEKISGVPVPRQVSALRELPVLHKRRCTKDPEDMARAVLEA
ncbi:MAG: threonine synthase [Clostridia bacterium]|nr:threonine synthase [Clostridia bacterium]